VNANDRTALDRAADQSREAAVQASAVNIDAVVRSPPYVRVFLTFARNSLVRDMTFRANFIIECISSVCWMLMNVGFYLLVFRWTEHIADWNQYEYFVFLATTMFVNSIVQAFFMPNAEDFSELIRTGGLDFALLKPIDTQFLISLHKVDWSGLANLVVGCVLLVYGLANLDYMPTPMQWLLYPVYVVCGVGIMYSVMIALAATSVWLGRNQTLYDFWFYITNFSRYPREIYAGPIGTPMQFAFTFVIPVLVVINVPARLMAKPFGEQDWPLAIFTIAATAASLAASRWVFRRAMLSYRSASS
jgi:ABC-2 type transport system permease protein